MRLDLNEETQNVLILFIIAAAVVTMAVCAMMNDRANKLTFVRSEYEQVTIPGNDAPVWQKVKP